MTLLRHNVSCSLFEQDLLVSELTSSIVKEHCSNVGRSGLEPPASRLSGVCSNQLSYRPVKEHQHGCSLITGSRLKTYTTHGC